MKDKVLKTIVTLSLGVNMYAGDLILEETKRSQNNALIVLFDTAGLNSSCKSLVDKNLSKYNSLINKKSLGKMRISSISYFTFDEQIKNIGTVSSSRTGKLIRGAKKVMRDVEFELKRVDDKKGKDVLSVFPFLNNLVKTNYSEYSQVGVLLFSNLRDSFHSKEERAKIKPIKMDEKITLHAYSASGLECINATTQQVLSAEKSVSNYYQSLIIESKFSMNNTYYKGSNNE